MTSDAHMNGYLALENGLVYQGEAFGSVRERYGELIFNTSMTGYQEILYDPSYKGQIVVMTYPLIGNYGINPEDVESYRPHAEGFVIKERSKLHSNWRSTEGLAEFFTGRDVAGIEGIDTREITLLLREEGALKGAIFTGKQDPKEMVEKVRQSPGMVGRDLVKEVVKGEPSWWNRVGLHKVVVLDCGVKYNMLRMLSSLGCRVRVMPPYTPLEEIRKEKPDGVLLSNGPGDPAALDYIVKTTAGLLGEYPIFGICLGQQVLGQALGGRTYKLKFGHHGANHPVKDLKTGKIHITVQNHGFCVDMETLKDPHVKMTHLNLNDQTLEGIRHTKYPAFSVQFHPEDSPGPHDSRYLFTQFIGMMEKHKKT